MDTPDDPDLYDPDLHDPNFYDPDLLDPERYATAIRGRQLRRLAVVILLEAHRPMTVGDVERTIRASGLRPEPAPPNKAVADALAREVRQGRARRVKWGVYTPGTIARGTLWHWKRSVRRQETKVDLHAS